MLQLNLSVSLLFGFIWITSFQLYVALYTDFLLLFVHNKSASMICFENN